MKMKTIYLAGGSSFTSPEGRDYVASLSDRSFVEEPRLFGSLLPAIEHARSRIGQPVHGGTITGAKVVAIEPRSKRFPCYCGPAIAIAAYIDRDRSVTRVRPRQWRPTTMEVPNE
jgi:hypothetical protein